MERHLTDSRIGKNTQLPLADPLRQSVYSRLAWYEDVNDAERLRRIRPSGLSAPGRSGSVGSVDLPVAIVRDRMTQADDVAGLAALNRELLARAEAINCPRRVVLDVESTEIPVHGEQEQNAYNGHFESTCYHPLPLFNREGDCLAATLRPRQRPQRRGLGRTAAARD